MEQYQLFINGEFIDNGDREMMDVVDPSTEEVISQVPKATPEDVQAAVDAAYEAEKEWKKVPAVERAGYVKEIAALVRENADALAQVIMQEQGKTWGLSHVESNFTADYMDYMAEFARRYEGEIIRRKAGKAGKGK